MKSLVRKVGLPLIIILGCLVVAVVMIQSKKPPEKKEVQEKAFLVDASPVTKRDLIYRVSSQGTVQPKNITTLSAQVSGQVVSVADAFIEGGMFKKGDVLVQLEQADYLTDLKAAEAELARAKAAFEEEVARSKVAEEEWRSVKEGPAPELGLRKPQMAKEMANVRAAEAQLERARRNYDRTTIRAPYDGLVKNRQVDLGQFVPAGSQVGTIYSTDVAEIRMPLTDKDLAFLELPEQTDEPIDVLVTTRVAGKEKSWQGKLVRTEGVLDSKRRVLYAIAEVQDPYLRNDAGHDAILNFGRFVQTQIEGNQETDIIVLPRNVLRLDGTVLVVDDANKIQIREVNVQRTDEQYVYVSGGLEAGELVATSAIPNPYEGMVVRLPQDGDPVAEEEVVTELAGTGEQ